MQTTQQKCNAYHLLSVCTNINGFAIIFVFLVVAIKMDKLQVLKFFSARIH